MPLLIVVVVLALILVSTCVKIVPQAHAYVIERLGGYKCTWSVGLHFKVPFLDMVARKVNLKEQVVDFAPQPVITKDNVTMRIDTVVFFQITDPKLFCYGVESPIMAIENLTATTLRNIIGDLELDQTLTSREMINAELREVLDEATDKWGSRVVRVEIQKIEPPQDIVDAMSKQMKAERMKRASILEAEGYKQSEIKKSEGDKQATILEAEGNAESIKKMAEADKQAAILRAEGEAAAIEKVYAAIHEGNPDDGLIAIKYLESLEKIADGKASKVFLPLESSGVLGSVAGIAELFKDDKKE